MGLTHPVSQEHRRMIESLIHDTRSHDGLAPLDLERFWADQDVSLRDPWGADIPQVPFGAVLTGECVFAELGLDEDFWRYEHDMAWRRELHRAYNDRAEAVVGRRILPEPSLDPQPRYPPVKGLHDVFEARHEWHSGSWWLRPVVHNEDELRALLDRVEARIERMRSFLLPPQWDEEKDRLVAQGVRPPLYRGQRGPVTFAMSIYGVENLIYLLSDNAPLAERFRNAILEAMLAIGRVLDEEAGYTPETAPRGFSFCDDQCALLTPEMYERFGYPILKAVFDRYAPGPGDRRFQHSDSAMGHLLPILSRLDLTGVNFGPTLTVAEIRSHLPRAVIHGQLAPFTYSRNEQENMVAEFLRDFEMARDKQGLVFATAGSIHNGTRLTSMRLLMAAIQRYGRYAT